MSAHPSRLLCSRSRSGRRSGLWDITKAETMLGNVPNAGKRMSASRARSSLRAMLRRAKERRRANDAVLRQLLRSCWVELVCSLFEEPMNINNRFERIFPASDYPAVPSGAPRKNHTWDICHLARPIRDVGSEGRRESVAGARCRCGFGET